jgi:hypothetical protein
VLAPTDRRLLLDVLAPPPGHLLDEAIGTTYSLDLLALLRVPLAATALPWAEPRSGGPVENPFLLLTALRRNASRISLYCHAGATKVPARHVGLLTFLEDVVHPVAPPNRSGVFHPKLWLLRFAPQESDAPIRYRLLVLSRNLTFDRSWDSALTLDGELLDDGREFPANRPLAAFLTALPTMAQAAGAQLDGRAIRRASRLADEVRRVAWSLPEGFDTLTFHPIGHDGRPRWPIADLRRLLVLSPFVGPDALAALRSQVREDMTLVSSFRELDKLAPEALRNVDEVEVFDDAADLLDIPDDADHDGGAAAQDRPVELTGLHAKVYVGERGRRAAVYVGSPNATRGAFDLNVEVLVELEGSRTRHGIDSVRAGLRDAGLLLPFPQTSAPAEDDAAHALRRTLERAAHELATGALRARIEPAGEGRWRPVLELDRPLSLGDLTVHARPLAEAMLRLVDLRATPCCVFQPTGLSSISAFFALRISGRASDGEHHLDVTLRLPLEGAPDGRIEAVTAELLGDRERLLRFLLLLLSDGGDTDRLLDELDELMGESGSADSRGELAAGLPLLEPMLRALHRAPERLDEIGRLLRDVRAAGGASPDLLPPELEQLWDTVDRLRAERA